MSVKDFKTKDEIRVRLNAGADDPAGDPAKRKGGLKPKVKKPEFLHRRTTAGGISFYDLGYLKTGGPGYSTPTFSIPRPVFRNLNAADAAARDAAIFAITGTNFKAHAYKIRKADGAFAKYNLIVNFTDESVFHSDNPDNLDQFSDDGTLTLVDDAAPATLSLSDNKFSVSGAPLVIDVTILDLGAFTSKVTAVYDHAAPAVAFTPSKNMDVFLMPVLDLFSATTFWAFYDRAFFLENDPELTYSDIQGFEFFDTLDTDILMAIVQQSGSTFYIWKNF